MNRRSMLAAAIGLFTGLLCKPAKTFAKDVFIGIVYKGKNGKEYVQTSYKFFCEHQEEYKNAGLYLVDVEYMGLDRDHIAYLTNDKNEVVELR